MIVKAKLKDTVSKEPGEVVTFDEIVEYGTGDDWLEVIDGHYYYRYTEVTIGVSNYTVKSFNIDMPKKTKLLNKSIKQVIEEFNARMEQNFQEFLNPCLACKLSHLCFRRILNDVEAPTPPQGACRGNS